MEECPVAKGTFKSAAGFLLLLTTVYGNAAQAGDGCAVLRELVMNSVHASAIEYGVNRRVAVAPSYRRDGAVGSTGAGRLACAKTVEEASRAFTEALGALNMPVAWNKGRRSPGDYCLSGDLSQCYPSQDPLSPMLLPNQAAFVYDAWKGVRGAVASHMPFGTANGLSRFTSGSLDAALSLNLNATVDGSLYSSYPTIQGGGARR